MRAETSAPWQSYDYVAEAARTYFNFEPFHARVHIGQGRRFLQESRDLYEVVFFDVFGSASFPFHLVTREAFAEARARLAPGGVLALNVETVGWQDPRFRSRSAAVRPPALAARPASALGSV